MVILRQYNTATATGTHVRLPVIKAGVTDFATGSDWTPAAGDVKLAKDGGTAANIGTLPTFTNGAWEFHLTGAELSCKQLEIMVVDAATKAVVDQAVLIETFGHASAMYPATLTAAAVAEAVLTTDIVGFAAAIKAAPDSLGGVVTVLMRTWKIVAGVIKWKDEAGVYDGTNSLSRPILGTDASADPISEAGDLS